MRYGDIIAIGHVDLRYLNQPGKIVIETPLAAPDSLIAIGPGAAALLRPIGTAATQTLAIGDQALSVATAASSRNVALGDLAAQNLTTGISNVVVGAGAGAGLVAGPSGNILIGDGVAPTLVAGKSNIVIGFYNGFFASFADVPSVASDKYIVLAAERDDGVAPIAPTLVVVDPELHSVHIGPENPGQWLTASGTDNVAIGRKPLAAVTTGSRNLAIGTDAQILVTTGEDNVAVGHQALFGSHGGGTAPIRNVVVGNLALNDYDAAVTDCVIVGYAAAEDAHDLQTSVLVGTRALNNANAIVNVTSKAVVIGYNAASAATTAAPIDAVIIGYQAALATTTAVKNVHVGSGSGPAVTTGGTNILVGFGAAPVLTTGANNVVVGAYVAGVATAATLPAANATGYIVVAADVDASGVNLVVSNPVLNNVHFGTGKPGNWLTATGSNDVSIGARAADALTIGSRNLAFGTDALGRLTTGDDNIAVGHNAMAAAAGSEAALRNVAIGSFALDAINAAVTDVVAVGYNAATAVTSGVEGVYVGAAAAAGATTGSRNIIVGATSAAALTTGSSNIVIGARNTAGGSPVGPTTSSFNVIVGTYDSVAGNTLAEIPAGATGSYIVIAAGQSLVVVNAGLSSVAIGTAKPGNWRTATGTSNNSIGAAAGDALTSGARNISIGANAGGTLTTGNDNTAVGNSALQGNAGSEAALRNVAIGGFSLDDITGAATDNVVVGYNAATSVTNLQTSVVVGASALDAATSSTTVRAVVIGYNAVGNAATAAPIDGVLIGYQAAIAHTTATGVVAIGSGSAAALTTGPFNTLIGYGVAPNLTTGRNNVVIGAYEDTAVYARTSAVDSTGQIVIAAEGDAEAGLSQSLVVVALQNVYVGSAKPGNWLTSTGVSNVGIGDGALMGLTSGTLNVVVGAAAGGGINSGGSNTVLGNNAGTTLTTGSRNILIGSGVGQPAVGTNDFLNLGKTIFGDLSAKNVRIGGLETVTVAGQTERLAVTSTDADTIAPFSIETTGANGAKIFYFSGTRDPNGLITGDPGDVYYRKSGVDSQPFVNVGAAAANTSWQALRTGALLRTTVLTAAAANFTSHAFAHSADYELHADGGGGGGASSTAGQGSSGGGGGSGGTTLAYQRAITPSTNYAYVNSAGGAGGAAGANPGTAGGGCSIVMDAATLTAVGGAGGAGGAAGTASLSGLSAGGAGGAVGTNGDVMLGGDVGQMGLRTGVLTAISGAGGGPGGAVSSIAAGAGVAATGYGGGGSGGVSLNGSAAVAGGQGAPSYIVVREYA